MNIKVNSRTGQVAIARGTTPLADAVAIYNPGDYKINIQKNQIATRNPHGGYDIHDVTPDQISMLSTPEAILARQTGGVGAISTGQRMPGAGEAALRGVDPFNLQDEIGAETSAGLAALHGDVNPIDPNHPVTGGMAQGFGPAFHKDIIRERQEQKNAKEAHPFVYGGTRLATQLATTGIVPAAQSVKQAAVQGGSLLGLLSFGGADTEDPAAALKQTIYGTGGGALLGAGAQAILRPALADTTAAGIAYRTIDENMPGGIGSTPVRASAAPAELSPVSSGILRGAAARNGPASMSKIDAAKARIADVNQAIIGKVNSELSPLDAELLLRNIQSNAKTANRAAYQGPGGAYSSPTRVGLTPETTSRPSFTDALENANARAADEWPPRKINPSDMSSLDMDLVDRALQRVQNAAKNSHGDTSKEALKAQATMETRGEVADNVRSVADAAFPDLKAARDQAAGFFGQEKAIETGRGWLKFSTSPEVVSTEYSALPASEKQAALAAFATDLKNALSVKSVKANLGTYFEKYGISDKLSALGVDDRVVAKIIRGGEGSRAVLDALQGGSDTALKHGIGQSMKSSLSNVRPGDLTAGAMLHSPAISLALPATRAIGAATEKKAAGLLVDAMTHLGPDGLASLYNRAPQTWGGYLSLPAAYAGGSGGSLLGSQQ